MKKILLSIAILFSFAVSASALPYYSNDGLTLLQSEFDTLAVAEYSTVSALDDFVGDDSDSSWRLGSSTNGSATMIIELAGYAGVNTFGIYDLSNISNSIELFDGTDESGDVVTLQIYSSNQFVARQSDPTDPTSDAVTIGSGFFASTNFGFYLDNAHGDIFYSNSELNSDRVDHMLAYQGNGEEVNFTGVAPAPWLSNEYVLAWEDLNYLTADGYDGDFRDMMVVVESMAPVPEPATLLLLGSGLVGLAFLKRRKS